MTPSTEDLVRQVAAIEMAAQALLLNARVLMHQLTEVVSTASGQLDASPSKPSVENTVDACVCPPKWRLVAPTQGHPTRTKCRNCGKEHD